MGWEEVCKLIDSCLVGCVVVAVKPTHPPVQREVPLPVEAAGVEDQGDQRAGGLEDDVLHGPELAEAQEGPAVRHLNFKLVLYLFWWGLLLASVGNGRRKDTHTRARERVGKLSFLPGYSSRSRARKGARVGPVLCVCFIVGRIIYNIKIR